VGKGEGEKEYRVGLIIFSPSQGPQVVRLNDETATKGEKKGKGKNLHTFWTFRDWIPFYRTFVRKSEARGGKRDRREKKKNGIQVPFHVQKIFLK